MTAGIMIAALLSDRPGVEVKVREGCLALGRRMDGGRHTARQRT